MQHQQLSKDDGCRVGGKAQAHCADQNAAAVSGPDREGRVVLRETGRDNQGRKAYRRKE
jgi:hypothetical protein